MVLFPNTQDSMLCMCTPYSPNKKVYALLTRIINRSCTTIKILLNFYHYSLYMLKKLSSYYLQFLGFFFIPELLEI